MYRKQMEWVIDKQNNNKNVFTTFWTLDKTINCSWHIKRQAKISARARKTSTTLNLLHWHCLITVDITASQLLNRQLLKSSIVKTGKVLMSSLCNNVKIITKPGLCLVMTDLDTTHKINHKRGTKQCISFKILKMDTVKRISDETNSSCNKLSHCQLSINIVLTRDEW